MKSRYSEGLALLERHKDELPAGDEAEKARYVSDFRKALEWLNERQPEDFRLAATMAVDGAKILLSVAIAVFVAIGGFIQYGITHGLQWRSPPIIILGIAELFAFLSMLFGLNAIGRAFKRGEGRVAKGETAWSTEWLRPLLQWQSYMGLATLITFAAAMVVWKPSASQGTFSISPVSSPEQLGDQSLTIEGQWSTLALRQGAVSLTLGPVPTGQTSSFKVESH
jgi:hypothetical protein